MNRNRSRTSSPWLEPAKPIKDRPAPKPMDEDAAEHRRRVAEGRLKRERVLQLELPVGEGEKPE